MPPTTELALFPLSTVLFPHMALPLHIFEDRYKQMIEACLAGAGIFGVVCIKPGAGVHGPPVAYETGTSARITGVQRRPDGKLDIAVEGVRRFRVAEIIQQRPYLVGQVAWLDEDLDLPGISAVLDTARALARECLLRLMALNNEWARQLPLPPEPEAFAYLVAERLPVDLETKQALLEAPTVAERLRQEVPLLEAERRRLQRALLNREWMERGRHN